MKGAVFVESTAEELNHLFCSKVQKMRVKMTSTWSPRHPLIMYSLSLLPSLIRCKHTQWTYAWACYSNCCISTAVEILFSTHFCHVPAELWHPTLFFLAGLLRKVCLLDSVQSVRISSGETSTRYIVCWVSSECVLCPELPHCVLVVTLWWW